MFDILKLTIYENLWIYRKRRKYDQGTMARKACMGTHRYIKIEKNQMPMIIEAPCQLPLTVLETAILHRRRAGMSREQLAKNIGIEASFVTEMEFGRLAPDELFHYWTEKNK